MILMGGSVAFLLLILLLSSSGTGVTANTAHSGWTECVASHRVDQKRCTWGLIMEEAQV
jgi:hypothetical protein